MNVALRFLTAAAALGALLLAGTSPAEASKKTHEDKKRGYRLKIEDSYVQNPPKPTSDEAYVVGDWYEDAAKFDAGYLRPTFQIFWFAEPKGEPAAAEPAPAEGPPTADDMRAAAREAFAVKDGDEALDRMLSINEHLFGPHTAMADRWREAEKDKTAKGVPFEAVEINPPTKKKSKDAPEPRGYCYVARMTLDRPGEVVHVTFFGSCSVKYTKRFQKEFPALVRSFEELKEATDSRNEGAKADLAQDREARYQQILEQKLVKGWKAERTENYILVYHEEVKSDLVKDIGRQIEAIRAQIYEVVFPPDKKIDAFSIVRVCKDREQYMNYGGSGGTAGYWSPHHEELVFFEDTSDPKGPLRVLYHEAFHQYIHYSVGDFPPHSWFNEGHGDFFAGHNYVAGKFKLDVFQWRVSEAKEWKRSPKRPPLKEWIQWTQAQYYGGNKAGIPGGANYALGWSLVYFLRTTKKPEYQGVLERYFNSLKGSVTHARVSEEEWEKKVKDAQEKGLPLPERDATSDVGNPVIWLKRAVDEAFKGIDWDQIEKDWLAADY